MTQFQVSDQRGIGAVTKSQHKRTVGAIAVAVYALLIVISVRTTPFTIDSSVGLSTSFHHAATDFTSVDRLGPSVFKVSNRYASASDTALFVQSLVKSDVAISDDLADRSETRLTDLPLDEFALCDSVFLCDPQGRSLYWIIPVALPQPLPAQMFVFIASRALAERANLEDPLVVLDQTSILGPAHDTPDCDLSEGSARNSSARRVASIGWAKASCAGPPLLVSTLSQWIVNGCSNLDRWQLCD